MHGFYKDPSIVSHEKSAGVVVGNINWVISTEYIEKNFIFKFTHMKQQSLEIYTCFKIGSKKINIYGYFK